MSGFLDQFGAGAGVEPSGLPPNVSAKLTCPALHTFLRGAIKAEASDECALKHSTNTDHGSGDVSIPSHSQRYFDSAGVQDFISESKVFLRGGREMGL